MIVLSIQEDFIKNKVVTDSTEQLAAGVLSHLRPSALPVRPGAIDLLPQMKCPRWEVQREDVFFLLLEMI